MYATSDMVETVKVVHPEWGLRRRLTYNSKSNSTSHVVYHDAHKLLIPLLHKRMKTWQYRGE